MTKKVLPQNMVKKIICEESVDDEQSNAEGASGTRGLKQELPSTPFYCELGLKA